VDVARGISVTGKGEGWDSAGVGWQAETRSITRMVIHKRRLVKFISTSFSRFDDSISES
jgi:hypothetical protein